jgi:hypothetical protein
VKSRLHRLSPVLVVVLIVGAIALRAATLLRYDLWYDELYSVFTALGDLPQLWASAVADRVHPPFFYLTLWGWLKLVEPTPTALRLLPLGIYLLAILASWWAAASAALSPRARAVTALAVAVNPIVFEAGAELRGNILLVTLLALVVGAMRRLTTPGPRRQADLAVLLLAAVAATWTHYFAWPSILAVVLILASKGRWRDGLLVGGATALAAIPWAVALAAKSRSSVGIQLAWSHPPTLHEALLLPGTMLADRTPVIAMAVAALLGWLLLGRALRTPAQRDLALLIAAPPLAMVAGGVVLGVGLWDPRYLIGAIVPLALLIGEWSDTPHRGAALSTAAVLALSAWGALTPATWRIPWRTVTSTIIGRAPRQPVYVFDGFTALPLRYYARMAGEALAVPEIKQWPDPTTPAGWLLLRPSSFANGSSAPARLRAAGRIVTDSVASGTGVNRVEAWRFR